MKQKDEGIFMMTNEDVALDNVMIWYLDTGASNNMCGHKHLFLDIQEIEDGHVSFGDSTKVLIKLALLKKSLCDEKIELQGLMEKSISLEELCNLVTNEKHNLLNERSVLPSISIGKC